MFDFTLRKYYKTFGPRKDDVTPGPSTFVALPYPATHTDTTSCGVDTNIVVTFPVTFDTMAVANMAI